MRRHTPETQTGSLAQKKVGDMRVRKKIRRIGNALGVVLSKDMQEHLGVEEGDELVFTRAQDAAHLARHHEKCQKVMKYAEEGMNEYRNALRELAK